MVAVNALLWCTSTFFFVCGVARHTKKSTHHTHHFARGVKIEVYNPESSYQTFSYGLASPSSSKVARAANISLGDEATAFTAGYLKINKTDMIFKDGYETDVGKVAYVKQSHNGIPFANAGANIGWHNGKVTAFGSSFSSVNPANISSSVPTINLTSIIPSVESLLGGTYVDQPPSLEYLLQQDGSARLTYVIQIRNETAKTWYEAFVDAHTAEVISVSNFVSHSSYTVVPLNSVSPQNGVQRIVNPQDPNSSPRGWHDWGEGPVNYTAGNNVISVYNVNMDTGELYPVLESSAGSNFNFVLDLKKDPGEFEGNLYSSITNAFYLGNMVHDFAYRYGFTEAARNFQISNFGKGGKEEDPVFMSVQRTDQVNVASFATLPDGQSGWCEITIHTYFNPRRDGMLANDVVIHELAHGITNRLVGDGSARCLQTLEGRSLGEGWSDFFADWVWQRSSTTKDFAFGTYLSTLPTGARFAPYSTKKSVYPLSFKDITTRQEEHAIGEIWANILHNVYADLVQQWGYSSNKLKDAKAREGNVVMMRLVMDSLKLLPCNPTLINARNAMIQADQNQYSGIHVCVMWRAFARLGMGSKAKVDGKNYIGDSSVPKGC